MSETKRMKKYNFASTLMLFCVTYGKIMSIYDGDEGGIIMNKNSNNQLSRAAVEQKYLMARRNLLLMLVLTAINIVLFIVGSNTMMLFSATVPYYAIVFGTVFGNTTFLMVCVCITLAIMITYLLCWILSKDHYAWMIVALVLFILDTLAMVGLYVLAEDFSGILDVVIHAWVLYYLIIGVRYGHQLKTMPEQTLSYVAPEQENEVFQNETDDKNE